MAKEKIETLTNKIKKAQEMTSNDPVFQGALKYIQKLEKSIDLTQKANKKIPKQKTKYKIRN